MSDRSKEIRKTDYSKELTDFEKHVLFDKGTEAPGVGLYTNTAESGTYLCRNCRSPLFQSDAKFASSCGWPSFDDALPNAVTQLPDADGRRTEIVCTSCNIHLGHVFLGEGFTVKNLRHCVNSVSMVFEPNVQQTKAIALLASGCFWGTEYHFAKAKGVLQTRVGFAGGHVKNPSYKEVCNGKTGHLECVEVHYNPKEVSYETLLKLFFETHDFSQENGQGPDIGPQYLSACFCATEEERLSAVKLISQLKEKGFAVATQVRAAAEFFAAEESHQKYYFRHSKTPYCHVYRRVF